MCELSVIIPAYSEEENVRVLIPRLKEVLKSLNFAHEILVIDTKQALDNTKDVCVKNEVLYFNREGSNSYGDAIRTGIKKAKGKHILFMDGDGSHAPEFIPNLARHKDDYDVVIASRYINGGNTDNPVALILMSRIVNIIYSLVLRLNCKDVSNSFKLYKSQLLKAIILKSQNFDIVEEILYKISKITPGLLIKEVPFNFKKRMFGNTKRNLVVFMISYIFTLFKLRFQK